MIAYCIQCNKRPTTIAGTGVLVAFMLVRPSTTEDSKSPILPGEAGININIFMLTKQASENFIDLIMPNPKQRNPKYIEIKTSNHDISTHIII